MKNADADSPAMAAGIQSGDIITDIDGTKIMTRSAYQESILKYKPGEKVKLSGQRRSNGGYVEIEFLVTVGSKE